MDPFVVKSILFLSTAALLSSAQMEKELLQARRQCEPYTDRVPPKSETVWLYAKCTTDDQCAVPNSHCEVDLLQHSKTCLCKPQTRPSNTGKTCIPDRNCKKGGKCGLNQVCSKKHNICLCASGYLKNDCNQCIPSEDGMPIKEQIAQVENFTALSTPNWLPPAIAQQKDLSHISNLTANDAHIAKLTIKDMNRHHWLVFLVGACVLMLSIGTIWWFRRQTMTVHGDGMVSEEVEMPLRSSVQLSE